MHEDPARWRPAFPRITAQQRHCRQHQAAPAGYGDSSEVVLPHAAMGCSRCWLAVAACNPPHGCASTSAHDVHRDPPSTDRCSDAASRSGTVPPIVQLTHLFP